MNTLEAIDRFLEGRYDGWQYVTEEDTGEEDDPCQDSATCGETGAS